METEPMTTLEAVVEMRTVNGSTFIVDASDAGRLSLHDWKLYKDGYVTRRDNKGGFIYLHREVLGLPYRKGSGVGVDHINRNKLDNRSSNLRTASQSQNNSNCCKRRKNTTGYKGVVLDKRTGKYVAQINSRGKHYYLGSFVTPSEAANAYDYYAIKMHKDFAFTNRTQK